MSKFTPGPWVIDSWGGACPSECHKWADENKSIIAGKWSICMVQGDNNKAVEANARLISASPDLYEALNNLLNCISETRGSDAHKAQLAAIAALAKADGKNRGNRMQSAEEFAKELTGMPYYVSLTKSERSASLIRARDREIVEACKKAVHAQDWRGDCGRGPAIDDALDFILRDLD